MPKRKTLKDKPELEIEVDFSTSRILKGTDTQLTPHNIMSGKSLAGESFTRDNNESLRYITERSASQI